MVDSDQPIRCCKPLHSFFIMVSATEKAYFVKGVINYMNFVSKSTSSRGDKKLASSPELKQFLTYLSETAPLAMSKVLKSVLLKCEKDLRVEKETQEKETQRGRKRPAPPDCCEGDGKRQKGGHKVTGAARATTVQPDYSDDDEEFPTENEIPSSHNGAQSPGTAFAGKSASNSDEGRGKTVPQPTQYDIEIGLGSGAPLIKEFVQASLLALKGSTRPSFNMQDEVAKIWKIVPHLDFFQNRHELHKHLESRENTSDSLQTGAVWNTSEPSEILNALEKVKRSTIDNKIHRAYGQTMLVVAVDNKVNKGYKSQVKAILEEIARDRSGPVTKEELDQITSSYFYEYQAGQRWRKIMNWFGGSGIVFIFVIGGTKALRLTCLFHL